MVGKKVSSSVAHGNVRGVVKKDGKPERTI